MSLLESISDKTLDISNKVAQKYRDHLGEQLTQKEEKLKALQIDLEVREKAVAERERKLNEFYLIRRFYINLPIGLAVILGIFYLFHTRQPDTLPLTSGTTASGENTAISSPAKDVSSRGSDYSSCMQRGIAYYEEIGSYPLLSTGERAMDKIEAACRASKENFK